MSFETLVLDNDSGDGTVEMVRSEFPQATLVSLDENIGFAAGVNRLAEAARGEFVLLLNPDTVVHPHAIESIVAFARAEPRHGLYGGRTREPGRNATPGVVLGQADALEPDVLRDDALDGVQGLARSSTPSRSARGSATPSARSTS